ncbi:MAG: hypothetical protein LBI72_06520 [Flavobacteriaceae bacterium]|jgi:hypothetical protein|nr:hypothetical protein [Flavobacteriaceae bacterium]
MKTITFKESAYPKPHQLEEFIWSGRLDKDGKLWFDLHLKSKDYYLSEGEDYPEDDDFEDDGDYSSTGNWKATIVWDNYHSCILSSKYWSEEKGILLSNGDELFDFDKLGNRLFTLDPLPEAKEREDEDTSFNIYLLGHDTCVNHKIQFTIQKEQLYHIQWTGIIALTYGGFSEFIHEFEVDASEVSFEGFSYPQEWNQEEALQHFKKVLKNIESFHFVDLNPKSFKREYKLMLKEI